MKKSLLPFISCFIIIVSISITKGLCQPVVTNSNFSGGTTGWTSEAGCSTNELGMLGEGGYGGLSGTNYVNEVDPGTQLCQTVSGFTVGTSYTLYFDLVRRTSTWTGGKAAPNPMKVQVCVGTSVNSATGGACATYTRSEANGSSWTLDPSSGSYNSAAVTSSLTFTAGATSLVVSIQPTSDAYTCCGGNNGGGMIVDNVSFTPPTPTPITLLNFKAVMNGSKVDINWQTATEINNDYYEVERSKDGINFTSIGKIKGAGNSSTIQEYAMKDNTPLSGISYYRLKQVDFDGKFSYSKIVAVENENAKVEIYPNPSHGSVNIAVSNDKEPYKLEVRDTEGRLVYQKSEDSGDSLIEISGLSKGVYVLILVVGLAAAIIIIRKLVVL